MNLAQRTFTATASLVSVALAPSLLHAQSIDISVANLTSRIGAYFFSASDFALHNAVLNYTILRIAILE